MEGNIINGYFVKRFLGQGTFGNTWLVEKDNNSYAMKLFKNEMIRSYSDEVRIEREIKSLQIVSHSNVIKYIDDGLYSQGYEKYRYLVMECAQGEPLRNYIQRHGKLTILESQKIINQVLDGLQAIHNHGLLHRDLKPDNIFITNLGEVKILDFGLVKILDASTLTSTGATMGTFAYMAPEQLKDSKHIDTRADLYSVGAILYHMVTGSLPLEINNLIEASYKILEVVPRPASSLNPIIPKKLDNIISNLLEKDAYWRKYTTAEALMFDLINLEEKGVIEQPMDLSLKLLPRLLHNEKSIVEEYVGNYSIDGIMFPANFLPKYRAVYDFVRNSGAELYIDPVVYRLAYSKFTNTKSLTNLPYVISENSKERPENFDSIDMCRNRAKKVIDWQEMNNSSVVIAPFHYVDKVDDPWIEKDLVVFNECKKYLNKMQINKPLYAGISIHIESISDLTNATRLVNLYTRIEPDGYMLMLDIDLETANKAHYYWFTKVTNMLSAQNKPIILSRVNDFGLGLTAFGATAISSGIGYIESFKESILVDDNSGFPIRPKYYIPQLLGSYNEQELKIIFEPASSKALACDCPYCDGSIDINYLIKPEICKQHYLYKKQEQIRLLNGFTKSERFRWMENQIDSAINTLKSIKKSTRSEKITYKHLEMWKDTFKRVQSEEEKHIHSTISPTV